jgi:hypothetical protein
LDGPLLLDSGSIEYTRELAQQATWRDGGSAGRGVLDEYSCSTRRLDDEFEHHGGKNASAIATRSESSN